MRLGIMQPYFYPYIGYFALIAQCDEWEVFDISQFTRRSWMTRNRILNPHKPWVYVSAPVVDGGRGKRTCEIPAQGPRGVNGGFAQQVEALSSPCALLRGGCGDGSALF